MNRRYAFHTCDVFTETRFGGNPLAVLPDARGLSETQMQQVAREFNYSETTFVLPAEAGNTRRVRIFTPATEVPFAGHPNIGTAFVLASTGALGALPARHTVFFEEAAGIVPVSIETEAGRVSRCELKAPQPLSLATRPAPLQVAQALSLPLEDVTTRCHAPVVASVGLPVLVVEVHTREALSRIRIDPAALRALESTTEAQLLHVYTESEGEFDFQARMFAPTSGVPEDPATGSANCTLAAVLAHVEAAHEGHFSYRIAQGVEMGRPSALYARAEKRADDTVEAWVAGACVAVAEGHVEVG